MSVIADDVRFHACLPFTLKEEGGYSNTRGDLGHATMNGITQAEFNAWRVRHKAPHASVSALAPDERNAIYHTDYWLAAGCDKLPAGLDLAVFDAAVNNGVHRAVEWEATARTRFNGIVELIDNYMDMRLEYDEGLGRLWRLFGADWERRIATIRERAKIMAGVPEQDA